MCTHGRSQSHVRLHVQRTPAVGQELSWLCRDATHQHEHQQDPTTQIPSLPTTTPDPSPTQTTTKFPKCGTQIKITLLPKTKTHLLSTLPPPEGIPIDSRRKTTLCAEPPSAPRTRRAHLHACRTRIHHYCAEPTHPPIPRLRHTEPLLKKFFDVSVVHEHVRPG